MSHDRLLDGLFRFSDQNRKSISKCITENLLGRICHSKKIEQRQIQVNLLEKIPGLPKLNNSQLEAVKKVRFKITQTYRLNIYIFIMRLRFDYRIYDLKDSGLERLYYW